MMSGTSDFAYSLLAKVKPPATEAVQERLRHYMATTGMRPMDLAAEIGRLGRSSIQHFINGTYEEVATRDDFIRAKLWDYMNRHPLQDEEETVPAKLLRTRDTRTLVGLAEEARQGGRIVVVEGPPGTSKTTALKWYWMERNRRQQRDAMYLRCWSGISGMAFLRTLCRLLGANASGQRDSLLRNAVRKLKEIGSPVLLVDEAQHLLGFGRRKGAEAFEQLRDVLDLAGCGCVLAGHFTFLKSLTNGLGSELEQWLSRIDLHEHLRGLSKEELGRVAEEYLGEPLPADVLQAMRRFTLARDRNATRRSALLPDGSKPLPVRYHSIRRVRKFLERVEELRSLPGNKRQALGPLARGAARLLLAPAGKAL
jgi:DNA transposition AAA+ family ATPase